MMIHAYQKTYLSTVQKRIASTFDFAINALHINGNTFVDYFLSSSICKRIEYGDVFYVIGKSGIELATIIYEEATKKILLTEDIQSLYIGKEYWIGWAVSYYQWHSNRKFEDIFNLVSYNDLANMYYPLHEADISKFCDILDDKFKEIKETNLKKIRIKYGITQKELAIESGVSLRSIQMYEQKNKDINKASVETVYALSKALGCKIEDLMENNS